jgi:phosphoribosylformylglycinamidine (FGAM) synthase-like enzyme
MDFSDALSELADIRAPGDVSWWPLAPGWWVLAAIVVALAIYGALRLQKRMTLQRRLGGAISEVSKARLSLTAAGADNMNQRLIYVNDINAVLRRVAMLHFNHNSVASLSGQNWVNFLHEHDKGGLLTPALAQVLSQGRFAARCDVDADALDQMARDWIKNLYMARIVTTSDSNTRINKHNTSAAAEHHA